MVVGQRDEVRVEEDAEARRVGRRGPVGADRAGDERILGPSGRRTVTPM